MYPNVYIVLNMILLSIMYLHISNVYLLYNIFKYIHTYHIRNIYSIYIYIYCTIYVYTHEKQIKDVSHIYNRHQYTQRQRAGPDTQNIQLYAGYTNRIDGAMTILYMGNRQQFISDIGTVIIYGGYINYKTYICSTYIQTIYQQVLKHKYISGFKHHS